MLIERLEIALLLALVRCEEYQVNVGVIELGVIDAGGIKQDAFEVGGIDDGAVEVLGLKVGLFDVTIEVGGFEEVLFVESVIVLDGKYTVIASDVDRRLLLFVAAETLRCDVNNAEAEIPGDDDIVRKEDDEGLDISMRKR